MIGVAVVMAAVSTERRRWQWLDLMVLVNMASCGVRLYIPGWSRINRSRLVWRYDVD
jgi:hypothetical protein